MKKSEAQAAPTWSPIAGSGEDGHRKRVGTAVLPAVAAASSASAPHATQAILVPPRGPDSFWTLRSAATP